VHCTEAGSRVRKKSVIDRPKRGQDACWGGRGRFFLFRKQMDSSQTRDSIKMCLIKDLGGGGIHGRQEKKFSSAVESDNETEEKAGIKEKVVIKT